MFFDPSVLSVSEYLENLNLPVDYLLRFSFIETCLDDVCRAVTYTISQAKRTDNILQSVIKSSFPVIGPYIVTFFNTFIRESVSSTIWKESLIMTHNKESNPVTMNDVSPISLLCFLSKVLERIVHEQLYDYIETRVLLDPFQTGYRKRHSTQTSTQTALLKLTDDIREGMEKMLVTMLMLFDFSKAFRLCESRSSST